MKLILAIAAFMLVSCADLPLLGTIRFRDPETGAKAGIDFTPGSKPSQFIKAPITNAEGVVIGYVDISSGK
jgi:hypothetical protein